MIERINPGKRASQMVLVDGRIETAGSEPRFEGVCE